MSCIVMTHAPGLKPYLFCDFIALRHPEGFVRWLGLGHSTINIDFGARSSLVMFDDWEVVTRAHSAPRILYNMLRVNPVPEDKKRV